MGTPDRSGLVGRAGELEALGAVLDRALAGVLGACFVEGEPGIGKTRLLTEVAVLAERQGAKVLRAEAEEYERARPFALRTELAELRGPDPDERRRSLAAAISVDADTTGSQFQLTDGFVELFETMAAREPLVVLADDLQWADPSSVAVLEAMLRRLASLPVLLIGAHRPSPLGPELARLLEAGRRAQVSYLRLVSLPDGDVTELVRRLAGGWPGSMLQQRVATCRGNPFLVTELLTAFRDEGAIHVAEDRAEVSDGTLPMSLRQTILRRLSGLPGAIAGVAVRDCPQRARLDDTSLARNGVGLLAHDATGLIVRGSTIRDNGAGIVLRDTAGATITANTLTGNAATDVRTASVFTTVPLWTGAGVWVSGGQAHDIHHNALTGHTYNIAVTGHSPVLHTRITHNTIDDAIHADLGIDTLGTGICLAANQRPDGTEPTSHPPAANTLYNCTLPTTASPPYPIVTTNLTAHALRLG